MWQNLQETADLVTITGEILNWKLHFLWSVKISNLLFHFSNTYSNISYENMLKNFKNVYELAKINKIFFKFYRWSQLLVVTRSTPRIT